MIEMRNNMSPEEQAQKASNEDLIQMWKNAHITWCRCGGHKKAQMNEYFLTVYEAEFTKRKMGLPANSDDGNFNGIGAF